MVPDVFHVIDKILTIRNDKINRKVLLQYKSNFKSKEKYTAPRTEEEKLVATIWKKNLNIENIDIFSNFCEIGGHSITAISIMIEIEKYTG